MTITWNFESFQYFNIAINFLKTKTFFKKLEYCFLVKTTKIENTSYKTAMSEAKR